MITDIEQHVASVRSVERARCAAITGHPEAKGREALALHLAIHTEMTPEQAAEMLAASPRAELSQAVH